MKWSYDDRYSPPAPSIDIFLALPDQAARLGPLRALVDTGADATLVPAVLMMQVSGKLSRTAYLADLWGDTKEVDVYVLDVLIDSLRLPSLEVAADQDIDEPIIGRNVLNKLRLILDGPSLSLELAESGLPSS